MTRHALRLALPAAVAALLVTVPFVAPTGGGTLASWSTSATVAPGPVSNDGLGMVVTADPAQASLPGASTVTVTNTSERLAGRLTVGSQVSANGWDSGLTASVKVAHTGCGSGAPATGTQLPPGSTVDLCLGASTSLTEAELLRRHAGGSVDITTTVAAQAVSAPTWTSQQVVTTRHTVPFPRPTHRGSALTTDAVCSGAYLGWATVYWAWPDSGVNLLPDAPAVHHWGLQRLDPTGWVEVRSNIPRYSRSTAVGSSQLLGTRTAETFRIVAYPSADPSAPVIGTFRVQITTVRSLLGLKVGAICTGSEQA